MIRKPVAILFVVSLAVVALALVPAAGLAAKGGGGGGGKPGGGGGGSGTSASVTASPNPASAWGAEVQVTGCGYDMYQPAELHVVYPSGSVDAMMISVWNPGCLHPTTILTAEPGTYKLELYQNSRRTKVLVATTDLVVT